MLIVIIFLALVIFDIGREAYKTIKGEVSDIGNDEGMYGIGNH
jgi:hypothetical protein